MAQATINLPPLKAYRMGYDIAVNGVTGRMVRPSYRVCVVDGKLSKGQPNATIKEMRSTFNNLIVEAVVDIDGETEEKTISLKQQQ